MKIRTSHVGSFPLDYSVNNVERIVKDYIEIGIDAPPYPQLRNFIDMYLQPLIRENIIENKDGFYIVKDLTELERLSDIWADIYESRVFSGLARNNFKYLRAPVTGPFTLSSNIYLKPSIGDLKSTILSNKRLFEHVVNYVRNTLIHMTRLGYNILVIDEPLLSVLIGARKILLNYTEEDIVNTIDTVFQGVIGEHGIHTCGRVSRLYLAVISSSEELDFINLEFYDTRDNLSIINRDIFETGDKILAPGVASSKSLRVESIDEIRSLILEIGNL
ncbi:MAG: methionine synthase, partial [Desulfurococcaceae archaeon]